jgi:hypothetical protein
MMDNDEEDGMDTGFFWTEYEGTLAGGHMIVCIEYGRLF